MPGLISQFSGNLHEAELVSHASECQRDTSLCNEHSNQEELLKAVLLAGLYPNLIMVCDLTTESSSAYIESHSCCAPEFEARIGKRNPPKLQISFWTQLCYGYCVTEMGKKRFILFSGKERRCDQRRTLSSQSCVFAHFQWAGAASPLLSEQV